MKKISKFIIGLLFALSVYLVVVAIWATASLGEVLPKNDFEYGSVHFSQEQLEILLKVEDPTFFKHPGIDISKGQGLTTITSSLASKVFLGRNELSGLKGTFQTFYKAVFACCKKVDIGRDIMALVLNQHVSKEQQLQLFASEVYFGRHNGKGVIGFPSAAEAYFNKPLAKLEDEEFVVLVAMLIAPNYYHPVNGKKELRTRVSRITAILNGTCTPSGWLDIEYEHCLETS